MKRDVRGYMLEVPSMWDRLTSAERQAMQNGIGPERWDPDAREVLDKATKLTAAADVHDVDYCVGRTKQDRKEADWRFLKNCCIVILEDSGGWLGLLILGGIFKAIRRFIVAWGLYRALRLFGNKAFREATKVDIAIRGPGMGTAVPEVD